MAAYHRLPRRSAFPARSLIGVTLVPMRKRRLFHHLLAVFFCRKRKSGLLRKSKRPPLGQLQRRPAVRHGQNTTTGGKSTVSECPGPDGNWSVTGRSIGRGCSNSASARGTRPSAGPRFVLPGTVDGQASAEKRAPEKSAAVFPAKVARRLGQEMGRQGRPPSPLAPFHPTTDRSGRYESSQPIQCRIGNRVPTVPRVGEPLPKVT